MAAIRAIKQNNDRESAQSRVNLVGTGNDDTRLLEEVVCTTKVGAWELDLRTGRYRCTPQMLELLDAGRDAVLTREAVRQLLPNQGFEKFEARFQKHDHESSLFSEVLEIDTLKRRRIVVRTTARKTIVDSDVKIIGTAQDVTHERVEAARKDARLRNLASALNAADLVIWRLDPDAGVVEIDEGLQPSLETNGLQTRFSFEDIRTRLRPDDREKAFEDIQRVFRTGEPVLTLWRMKFPPRDRKSFFDIHLLREITERGHVGVIGVVRDVTRDLVLQERLKDKRKRAEEGLAAQRDFVARMSHEIRTPMNGVIGMLEVLRRTGLTAQQLDHVETSLTSAKSLLHLLNDVIDLSQFEVNQVSFRNEPFQPGAIVEEAASIFLSRAQQNGLSLDVYMDVDLPDWLRGDDRRIRQILTNLIGNAIKYTPKGGVDIFIEYCETLGELKILVRDTGMGMPREQISRIFDEFYQIDAEASKNQGGSGLGLAICKQLAEQMGGKISVDSREDMGSDFCLTIPAALSQAPDGLSHETSCGSPDRPLRILVAEDNKAMQTILSALLTPMGHDVVVVGDGKAAVAEVASSRFDVVLMDVMMPVMDGPTAARRIRELDGRAGGVPIIALTANALSGDKHKYIAAGMTDYLAKPVDVASLLKALAKAADATA